MGVARHLGTALAACCLAGCGLVGFDSVAVEEGRDGGSSSDGAVTPPMLDGSVISEDCPGTSVLVEDVEGLVVPAGCNQARVRAWGGGGGAGGRVEGGRAGHGGGGGYAEGVLAVSAPMTLDVTVGRGGLGGRCEDNGGGSPGGGRGGGLAGIGGSGTGPALGGPGGVGDGDGGEGGDGAAGGGGGGGGGLDGAPGGGGGGYSSVAISGEAIAIFAGGGGGGGGGDIAGDPGADGGAGCAGAGENADGVADDLGGGGGGGDCDGAITVQATERFPGENYLELTPAVGGDGSSTECGPETGSDGLVVIEWRTSG